MSPPSAPWVLLRGLTRERRHWGGFPALLQAAFPGTAVLAPDLPGNGARWRERSPASVDALAEDLRATLRAEGHEPPYRLLALSLGAMVAVAWAERHPQELASAVLLNTSLRPYSPFWQRLRPAAWPALLKIATGDAEAREAAVLRLTAQRPPEAAALLRDWTAWRRACPVSRANALRQLWAAASWRAPDAGPAAPLLLLAGARDALVDARCSQALARAWGVPLAIHPDAGHDLPLDAGPWVVERVRAWAAAPQSAPTRPPETAP